jgi:hypothetical protein
MKSKRLRIFLSGGLKDNQYLEKAVNLTFTAFMTNWVY